MATRVAEWRGIVLAAEPSHARDAKNVAEYEFGNGRRQFSGDYAYRGAYARQPTPSDALTWNGVALAWGGQPLTYGDEE